MDGVHHALCHSSNIGLSFLKYYIGLRPISVSGSTRHPVPEGGGDGDLGTGH